MQLGGAVAPAQRLGHEPYPAVGGDGHIPLQIVIVQQGVIIGAQGVHMLLQRTDSLHQRRLEGAGYGHHLPGGLHLCAEPAVGGAELIEGEPGHLDHAVVQHGLEGGPGHPGHGVVYLIQVIAQGYPGGNLGYGVSGGLGGQGRGARHSGVDLYDTVAAIGGMERVLHITTACYPQSPDYGKGGGAQHMIFLIR